MNNFAQLYINLDRNFIYDVIWNGRSDKTANIINDYYFNRNKKDVYDVDFVMASHWLITRKCLEIVGGFSPSFSHYGEDNNYTDRAHYWGIKVGIVPSSQAIHDRGERKMDKNKELYLLNYIIPLRISSNPNSPVNVKKTIKRHIKDYILHKNSSKKKYAIRLWKERRTI